MYKNNITLEITLLKPYNFRKTMKKLKNSKEMSVLILFSHFFAKGAISNNDWGKNEAV